MNDLISRQAAIKAICEDGTMLERQGKYTMTMAERKQKDADILDTLPPAQLAQDLPKGCTDTISRAAALSALNGLTKIFLNNLPPTIDRADAVDAIKALPSAQPEITNEEIRFVLKQLRVYFAIKIRDGKDGGVPVELLKLVEEIQEYFENTPPAQPGWISCSESPMKNNSYLVWMPFAPEGHHITVAEWCGSYWNIKTPITAWMPLPKPYREGGQE